MAFPAPGLDLAKPQPLWAFGGVLAYLFSQKITFGKKKHGQICG